MKQVTDEKLINSLLFITGKHCELIMESCNRFHFYFENNTSYSYSKNELIQMKACND